MADVAFLLVMTQSLRAPSCELRACAMTFCHDEYPGFSGYAGAFSASLTSNQYPGKAPVHFTFLIDFNQNVAAAGSPPASPSFSNSVMQNQGITHANPGNTALPNYQPSGQ